ncbi:hypothetical protein [Halorhabdus sp. SVX81]|nr:hypothetical protein [Halorhabdus sp. SVX81]
MPIPGGTEMLVGSLIILLPILALVVSFLYKWLKEGYDQEVEDSEFRDSS